MYTEKIPIKHRNEFRTVSSIGTLVWKSENILSSKRILNSEWFNVIAEKSIYELRNLNKSVHTTKYTK